VNEGQWHRKTFYGVTIGDQDWDARDIQSGIAEEQQFDARYFIPANLPRLDFYYGSERIFTVTQQGIHDLDFEEGSVTSVPGGGFGILSNGTLVAAAVQGSLTASQYLVNG
jgi:hypothetical protein